MARQALPYVLGTPAEPSSHAIVKAHPEIFQADLVALCAPFVGATRPGGDIEVEIAFTEEKGGEPDGFALPGQDEKPAGPVPMARRRGALRLLGLIGSEKALETLVTVAGSQDDGAREAVAHALQFQPEENGLNVLRKLAGDGTPQVAFSAAFSLWRRSLATERLLPLARRMADGEDRHRLPAAEALAQLGEGGDIPALKKLSASSAPGVRVRALRGLLRLKAVDAAGVRELLGDTDERVVTATLGSFFRDPLPGLLLAAAKKLANDPHRGIASDARTALALVRPADVRERMLFDLETEHTYTRIRTLESLPALEDEWATAAIERACANLSPHTRARALGLLTERAPARARKAVMAALGDAHRWVRLHASALAAECADAASGGLIGEALKAEADPAIRLYLEAALARAEDRPTPPPREAAHSVAGKGNLTWLCAGMGEDVETSPLNAYYSFGTTTSPAWRRAHDAGKTLFGRVSTVGNPGLVVLNDYWRDGFWQAIDSQLREEDLPYVDGLVFGEESMSMSTGGLWRDGWRPFCLEAGIDPRRVRGDMGKLTVHEQRAWSHWASERAVDGFNVLYDYVKFRYARLRPGLQVCTFLPGQGGISPADFRWKFDVGGVYDYKGDNRMAAYNLVRRYKTIWPDRPVLWFSLGIGGYEMNIVRWNKKVPAGPLMGRWRRCYVDSVTAWIAGADTGWFSTWMFVARGFKYKGMSSLRGVQVGLEDLGPGSKMLERAISYSFSGLEEEMTRKAEAPPPDTPDLEAGFGDEFEEVEDLDAEEKAKAQQEAIEREVEQKKDVFRRGFHLYQKYVYDCARVFASLPRQHARPEALCVRPRVSVWTRPAGGRPLVPGMALLTSYDFLTDVNKVSGLDLSRYRFIVVHDPGLLRDETIAALTRWLADTPGVLYVHRNLAADDAAEASTVADHDGRLENDWPWEKDVSIGPRGASDRPRRPGPCVLSGKQGTVKVAAALVGSVLRLTGGGAEAIYDLDGSPVLAVWRKPGEFKGAVLFDGVESASREYLDALRAVINGLHESAGVGVKLDGPLLHVVLQDGPLRAVGTTRYYGALRGSRTYPGFDLLTGALTPEVGRQSRAAIMADDYVSEFVAVGNNLGALSDQPFMEARKIDGGLLLHSAGLVRVVSGGARLKARTQDGNELPKAEDATEWILTGTEEGIAELPFRDTDRTITWLRAKQPVLVSPE